MRKCLYMKVDVLIEGDNLSPSVVQEFSENFDYTFTSNTEGVKVVYFEIIDIEDGGE